MNIAVSQVDGKMPNVAIMKIAAFHLNMGDKVSWYEGPLFADQYDRIYFSKIFTFSKLPSIPVNGIVGGTGIDYVNHLPEEIENTLPDYSLYPDCDYHIGFSMKGCRNVCKFCCVPKKEGKARHYNSIQDILLNPKGKNKLVLLDNDFFGGPDWEENIKTIINLKLKVCFSQGLNIRTINLKQAELLSKCNYYNLKFTQKYLSFAWDNYRDKEQILKGIKICNKAGIPNKNMQFFLLIGFNSTPEEDYERVKIISSLGCLPFVMKYNKSDCYQKRFARWVNQRAIFKTVNWADYKTGKHYE